MKWKSIEDGLFIYEGRMEKSSVSNFWRLFWGDLIPLVEPNSWEFIKISLQSINGRVEIYPWTYSDQPPIYISISKQQWGPRAWMKQIEWERLAYQIKPDKDEAEKLEYLDTQMMDLLLEALSEAFSELNWTKMKIVLPIVLQFYSYNEPKPFKTLMLPE